MASSGVFRAAVLAGSCAIFVGAGAFHAHAQAVPGPEAHPSVTIHYDSLPPPGAHPEASPEVAVPANVPTPLAHESDVQGDVPPPAARPAPAPEVGTSAPVASPLPPVVASKSAGKHRRHRHGRKSADTTPLATNPVATP